MPNLIEALSNLGHQLVERGQLQSMAFRDMMIGGYLDLDLTGQLVGITKAPSRPALPAAPPRTSGVAAAFLSGKPAYWIGGPRKRDQSSLDAARDLHREVLTPVDHPVARAILAWFDQQRAQPDAYAALTSLPPALSQLSVRVDGQPAYLVPEIRAAWAAHSAAATGNAGHPTISNIVPATSPVKLVTSNLDAARSFGQTAAVMPPGVDEDAYGAGLNWLLRRNDVYRVEESAVVAWDDADLDFSVVPYLVPTARWSPVVWPSGRIRVAMLDRANRGRASVRLYAAMPAAQFRDRVELWSRRLSMADGDPRTIRPWQFALKDRAGAARATGEALRALLDGRRPPLMLQTILRYHRPRPGTSQNLAITAEVAGLLGAIAGHGEASIAG